MKSPQVMQAIGASLSHVVGLVYPIIVCIILAGLTIISFRIVCHAGSYQGLVRRATGLTLPFIMLVFFFADAKAGAGALTELLDTTPVRRFGLGLAVGVGIIELCRLLIKLGSDGGPALAAFFFSFLNIFIMFSVVVTGIEPLHLFLFGTILSAGFDIMFIGLPDDRPPRLPPPSEKPYVLTARDPD